MSEDQPTLTLADLQPGQSGVVAALQSTGLERRRMMDLGIVPGTLVRVEVRSPLGDPVACRVRGALLPVGMGVIITFTTATIARLLGLV